MLDWINAQEFGPSHHLNECRRPISWSITFVPEAVYVQGDQISALFEIPEWSKSDPSRRRWSASDLMLPNANASFAGRKQWQPILQGRARQHETVSHVRRKRRRRRRH